MGLSNDCKERNVFSPQYFLAKEKEAIANSLDATVEPYKSNQLARAKLFGELKDIAIVEDNSVF